MALEFSLEGLTEEQLRGARQFQQRLQGVRAARTVGAAPAASPLPGIVNTTAESTRRATAGPAVSTPTVTNPAPVATAEAANRLSFGQRAMRVLKAGGRALGAAGVGAVGLASALTTARTPTSEYERRLGVGPSNLDSPALRFFRDLGVRSAGALIDLGDVVNPFSGAVAPARVAQPTTGVAAASGTPGRAPIDAEALIRGTGIPEPGTGAFRVGSRPAVAVDSRGRPVETPAVAAPAAAAPAASVPVLGTEGGIFANAVPFMQQVAQQRGIAAAQTQAARRATATFEAGIKERETEVKEAESVSSRIKALADVQAALGAGKKVTADIMGNPVVTDVAAGTALRPTVREPITEKQIKDTMRIEKMTRAQVLARLREEGRID